MSEEEQQPEEIEPVEPSEVLEPVPEFGEHDEAAQKDEWEQDALEGGC